MPGGGLAAEAGFWQLADRMLAEHALVIDRPRGSAHPRHPDLVYPLDYGYLAGTSGGDGGGIDVWRGSGPAAVTAALCSLDAAKRDAEVKFLVGCSEVEIELVQRAANASQMRALLIRR